jgi:hypothetical protein
MEFNNINGKDYKACILLMLKGFSDSLIGRLLDQYFFKHLL